MNGSLVFSHSAKRHLLLYGLFVNKPVRVFGQHVSVILAWFTPIKIEVQMIILVKADRVVDFYYDIKFFTLFIKPESVFQVETGKQITHKDK